MKIVNAALRKAAAHDRAVLAGVLLGLRGDPYDSDVQGRTAFNCAASNGLRALALLTAAAFSDTQKAIRKRRWRNYDLNTPSGAYGSTLITYAAKAGSDALIREMIEAGADLRIVNGSGWSLLHCAAVMPGRAEILQSLLQALRTQGLEDLIAARTTRLYETRYNGHKVIYEAGLTAAGLCRARMAQDPRCPPELARYLELV